MIISNFSLVILFFASVFVTVDGKTISNGRGGGSAGEGGGGGARSGGRVGRSYSDGKGFG